MNDSSTVANPIAEKIAPSVLVGMTAVTGFVDAVSFLSLGSVFTANMTGNILILAFATARASGRSVARSTTALIAFAIGAILGGRIMARASADSRLRFAMQPFVLIVLTALAMGMRNAAVRKLSIPDITTTVLTMTVTAIAADSSLAKGNNPRFARRFGSILALFFGAAVGAVLIRYSIAAALGLATAISAICSAALFRALRTPDQQ